MVDERLTDRLRAKGDLFAGHRVHERFAARATGRAKRRREVTKLSTA